MTAALPAAPRNVVEVAVGVVLQQGCVLIAQRPAGKDWAGRWEFPGGKLEAGEARHAGLCRELAEELGIGVLECRPLIRVRHSYPRREVLLDAWLVTRYSGEPRGLDGQALRWSRPADLSAAELLEADAPIIHALRLPPRLTERVTSDYRIDSLQAEDASPSTHRLCGAFCADLAQARAALGQGAMFLALRRRLEAEQLRALCAAVSVPVFARGIDLEEAWALGASGLNEITDD